MLAKGGLSTKGWISNKDLTKNKKEISDVTEVLKRGEGEGKVLGIVWNQKVDQLVLKSRRTGPMYQSLQSKAKSR